MKFAINIINFGDCADARLLAGLARDAEDSGWDGFFIWDHVALDWGAVPMVDPWIALTAIAMTTQYIRFGALVTPLPRRRPWKFARETVSLDRLSNGRLIVGVGIGVTQAEFANLGEPTDLKIRAAMLDEGLDIVTGLWRGEPFCYEGEYYTVQETVFTPPPVQLPRIPIWTAGMLPYKAPLRRAARWDGIFPILQTDDPNAMPTPEELAEAAAYIQEYRADDLPFDMTIAGVTPGDDLGTALEIVKSYEEVGVTWWQEAIHLMRPDLAAYAETSSPIEAMRWRIRQGPPCVG